MKEFTEQLNDLIAPVTRAWTAPDIQKVTVEPGAIGEDEIIVVATIKLKRRKPKRWQEFLYDFDETKVKWL
jgi:hypothetical protein